MGAWVDDVKLTGGAAGDAQTGAGNGVFNLGYVPASASGLSVENIVLFGAVLVAIFALKLKTEKV